MNVPRVVVGLGVLGLVGCGRFNFDYGGGSLAGGDGGATGGGDGGSTTGDPDGGGPPCTFGPWSQPVHLTELSSDWNDFAADLSADGLTLYFESNRFDGDSDIYMATRTAIGQPWSAPVQLTSVNTGAHESDPELSQDGLTLYFGRFTVVPDPYLFRATRAQLDDPFGSPQQVAELDGEVTIGQVFSSDGTEMFYTKYMQYYDLAYATLEGGELVPQRWLDELNTSGTDGWPSLASDDRTLYFESDRSGNGEIYVTTRPARGMPFGAPMLVPELSGPGNANDGMPEISRDGTELYFTSDRAGTLGSFDLYVVTRSCL